MPFQVVLSYRRGDAAGNARSVYEALADRFGEDNVFMDVDAIEPGVDFVDAIRQAVGSCDVFLALIGQQWLTAADRSGQRRLDDPNDYVRLEIETALAREIRLIPVLVQDVDMPSPEELPPSLAPLARRNAIDIRDTSWRSDVERLIETLERLRQQQPSEPGDPGDERPPDERGGRLRLNRRLAIAAAVVALTAAAFLAPSLLPDDADDDDRQSGGSETRGRVAIPESARIAFAADGRVFVVDADGSHEVDVTGRRSSDNGPDWSPGGDRLAFARADEIWIVTTEGERRPITTGKQDGSPDWAPDGKRIAFDRKKDKPGTATHDVWVTDTDGASPRLLTNGKSGAAPDWSPDGTRIVFQRLGRLYWMRADGTGELPVPLAVRGTAHQPAWSPDGAEIAFALDTAGRSDIYVFDVDDPRRTIRNLTAGRVTQPESPAWTSDGARVLFTAVDGIWAVNREGVLRRLIKGEGLATPAWRPRGPAASTG